MALTTHVFVGKAQEWIPDLVEKVKKLNIGYGMDKETDVAPLCYPELRDRVLKLLDGAEKEGADLILDGRKYKNEKYPDGYFVGPTVIDNVTADMECYKEEIFGPAVCIVR